MATYHNADRSWRSACRCVYATARANFDGEKPVRKHAIHGPWLSAGVFLVPLVVAAVNVATQIVASRLRTTLGIYIMQLVGIACALPVFGLLTWVLWDVSGAGGRAVANAGTYFCFCFCYAIGVLHLWHPESDRSLLPGNDTRLDEVMRGDRICANPGLTTRASADRAIAPDAARAVQ